MSQHVRTQSRKRQSRYREYPVRWAYVIEQEGYWPFVSRYAYTTEEAARRAGEADARATRAESR